jgi:hypothetical protein
MAIRKSRILVAFVDRRRISVISVRMAHLFCIRTATSYDHRERYEQKQSHYLHA